MYQKRLAVVTGILFITATVATVISQMLLSPLLDSKNLVSSISGNALQFRMGMFFELLNAFASAGIAISLFAVLWRKNEPLAVGYLGIRLIEGTLGVAAVAGYAALFDLSKMYSVSGGFPSAETQSSLNLLIQSHDFQFLQVLIAFNVGAFILYGLLYRTKLVPRGIAVWGFIGALLLAAANLIQFFDFQTNALFASLLTVPIALNEMALAIWLILKGFRGSLEE